MACPRNESGDYAVFLAAYTRSFGDDICLSFTYIKAAPFARSAAVVIARRFFSANSAAVLTFPVRMCYNIFIAPVEASVSMLSHTICDVPVRAWIRAFIRIWFISVQIEVW